MCEFCSKSEVTVEKLTADEQLECEWFSEESAPGACDELAVYAVSTWFVDDHLCDAHRLATEKEMAEEGLAEVLENAGFRSEFEIRPIQEQETCDYILPTATDWKPCGERAKFAKFILDTTVACAEHAAQMSEESKES